MTQDNQRMMLPAHGELGSSFVEHLRLTAPHLLPFERSLPVTIGTADIAPHGTTIVAMTFEGGVLMAGDRRATMGNLIAQRDIEKVFPADDWSAVGIAGTAGLAVEMVRLFQLELEHYEKIEGQTLSLDGKANRLSTMIRNNLAMALQGLAVVPMFAGFDTETQQGRIWSYDVTGGRSEERGYQAVGSGSIFAKGSLKKLYRDDLTDDAAARLAIEALYDAADDDSATGGPDLTRKLWPIIASITTEGLRMVPTDEVGAIVESVVSDRMSNPGGAAVTRAGGETR